MPPVAMPPPDIWLTNLHALITLGNVILLLCLLGLYVKNFEQIKSKFALGLIGFVILLLVQAFMSNPFVHLLWGFRLIHALGLLTILSVWFEFAALAILLYISLKPE
jgi:hypothetical protein